MVSGRSYPWVVPWCQGAVSGGDRFGQPDDLSGRSGQYEGTLPQRNTAYHIWLDDFSREKIRRRLPQRLPGRPILMPRTAARVDIRPVRPIVMPAMNAAQVIDPLPGKTLGGKPCVCYNFLAVRIGIAGIGGLVARHSKSVNRYSKASYALRKTWNQLN